LLADHHPDVRGLQVENRWDRLVAYYFSSRVCVGADWPLGSLGNAQWAGLKITMK